MAKQKTKQAARKRFKVSAKGKVKHRAPGQAHFNARSTGEETRRKHHDKGISKNDYQRVKDLIPYDV